MKRPIVKVFVWLIVIAGLWLLISSGYRIVDERRQQAASKQTASEASRVVVHKVRATSIANSVQITGEVEALAVVDVVPKISGTLERLRINGDTLIEEGTIVRQGQVIVVIEHSALDAAVARATAAVAVARASRERVQVNADDCLREKNRMENLFKGGSVTEQLRDRAATAYEQCLAEMKLVEAQITQAKAALLQTQVNRDEATIEAPIDGLVSKKYVDEGDMVGPAAPLLTIMQIDTVKVVGGASERHIPLLAAGRTAAVMKVDAYKGEEFTGVVHRVGPDVNRMTRTAEIEVRIANDEHRLRPGMFARLNVVLEQKDNAIVVPDAAVMYDGSQTYLYVVDDSNAHRRNLTLGISMGTNHEVVDGDIKPGDLVIVAGHRMLEDGAAVTIVEEAQP